jgi:hypothetical protein
MASILVPMVDGGIYDIETDTENWGGCETCDYGSSYINSFTIKLTTGLIYVKIDSMYEYALSEDYMMKLMLRNVPLMAGMTEVEFSEWLKKQVEEEVGADLETFEFSKR